MHSRGMARLVAFSLYVIMPLSGLVFDMSYDWGLTLAFLASAALMRRRSCLADLSETNISKSFAAPHRAYV